MCGIAAYLGSDISAGRQFVCRANALLAHRGPDDEGAFVGDRVVLGHRRLKIVDLTNAAHQPMTSPDGRWTLIYNGEVYNHASLRAALSSRWTFRSRSDTETVLAALAVQGPDALERMVGMWALALWDADTRTLLLSRDRYGQKPLYWRSMADGSMRFASEIAPLIDAGEQPEMYQPAIAEFLATGNYGHLGTRTFFRDVQSFPPAHWARVSVDRQITPTRYWRFPIVPGRDQRPYDDVVGREFADAFQEAVASQLMSDVPVGATLSGGLDSTAVAGAMAASSSTGRIPIFTAQAAGYPHDESAYVKAVAARWGGRLDIHWVDLRQLSLATAVGQTIRAQEEPFGDPSIVAHGLLMDAARAAGVPVVLGGQGGDELLFGYTGMGHALLATSLRAGNFGWVFDEAKALGLGTKALARIGLAAAAPGLERRMRERSRRRRRTWMTPVLQQAAEESRRPLAASSDANSVWLEFVERLSLPHLTHYDDRSGMRRSIEGRMPFLDHRLATVVASLQPAAFLHDGKLKHVLRDACKPLFPVTVLERRDKIGFFTPLAAMLRADHDWVRTRVTDDYARAMGVFEPAPIISALDRITQSRGSLEDARRVWRTLAVRVWSETFQVRPAA